MSGIYPQTDMAKTKYQWVGVDDGQVVEPVIPKDKAGNVVALSAQRVRQFYIHFIPLNSNYGVSEQSQKNIDKIFASE
jgi:hypothetical protein